MQPRFTGVGSIGSTHSQSGNQGSVLEFSITGLCKKTSECVTTAAEYRDKAEQFHTMAQREGDSASREEYERLAQCYVRLADLAERNSLTDIVYETPPRAESKSKPKPVS